MIRSTHRRYRAKIDQLSQLAYELLDAHWETSQITHDWQLDDAWELHLRYLRDLQRAGRELLADAARPVGGEATRRVGA